MAAYVLDKNLEEELASSPDTALPKIEIQRRTLRMPRFSFDITDLDKSSLKIYVVDYALNEAAYPVEMIPFGIPFISILTEEVIFPI